MRGLDRRVVAFRGRAHRTRAGSYQVGLRLRHEVPVDERSSGRCGACSRRALLNRRHTDRE